MAKIQKKSALIGVFLIAAVLSAWKFVWEPYEHRTEDNMTLSPIVEVVPSVQQDVATTETVTQSVKVIYATPAGQDPVGFNITTDKEGVIIDAKVEVLAKNSTSQNRQRAFAADLPQVLIGKKLSELTAIDRVGGSSLTTKAFNASLEKLKSGV